MEKHIKSYYDYIKENEEFDNDVDTNNNMSSPDRDRNEMDIKSDKSSIEPRVSGKEMISFHGVTISTTLNDLIRICGEPEVLKNTNDDNFGAFDKVIYQWEMETSNGIPFNIYDWKEFRNFEPEEIIEWHIGSIDFAKSYEVKDILNGMLGIVE